MPKASLTRSDLKTPKAAAIAGILFSVLLIAAFSLLRMSVPADPYDAGAWLRTDATRVALGLNLIPFAGVAFLWFIGVLRDRLGEWEDRFFATVFLGSGVLFLVMLFVAAALMGAILLTFAAQPDLASGSPVFVLGRAAAYNLVNIYMVKMAAVFMFSTSMVEIRTGIVPRWIAMLGFALALLLLFASGTVSWSFLVFPLWVLLTSVFILVDNLRRRPERDPAGADS